jgi:hypothetical protein
VLLDHLVEEAADRARGVGADEAGDRLAVVEEAIAHLRAAIRLEETTNVRGDGHLRLADLLARSDDPERWKEAREVLELTSDGDLAFSKERLRFAVSRARLSAKEGDDTTAASFAKAALAEAARTKPDFSRHPDLGWANTDPDTVAEMRALAGPS